MASTTRGHMVLHAEEIILFRKYVLKNKSAPGCVPGQQKDKGLFIMIFKLPSNLYHNTIRDCNEIKLMQRLPV